MKFSELWLREWVNPAVDRDTLIEQMTMSGLEINNTEEINCLFEGIIIGEIIECVKLKNDNKNYNTLYHTKVNLGNNSVFNIICSSLNCRIGLKVATAIPGTILPGHVLVKKKKILNIDSYGILCSKLDLGIDNNDHEIIELPIDAPIGKNMHDYINFKDTIIEVSISSNRADCFSIIGIAREVAAINNLKIKFPHIKKIKNHFDEIYPISIESKKDCPVCFIQVIKNVNCNIITPLWMKNKLLKCSFQPINIIHDIINYILIELGQPIHIFDLDCIEGEINIRLTKENEILKSNNKKIKLKKDILVISDNNKILSVAGIFDSNKYSINENTNNVLFVCAYFDPTTIYNNTQKCNTNTDFSQRYERGVDPMIQYQAINFACNLIYKICGGKIGPIIEKTYYSSLLMNKKIILHRKKLNKLIGYILHDNEITNILTRLGFKVKTLEEKWNINIPSWRFDINLEEDIIEELMRIYGYQNIPAIPINAPLIMKHHSEQKLSLNRVKFLLIDKGYQETITYSFVDPLIQKLLHPNQKSLILSNPISTEMSVMRISLWTGLIKTVLYNQKRQQNIIRLFESGFCFIPNAKEYLEVEQNFILSGLLAGNRYEEQWGIKSKQIDFYDLKGDLESIFELNGILDKIEFRLETHPALHPGESASIYMLEKKIGLIGKLHPNIGYKLNLKNPIMIFEILWNSISICVKPNMRAISKFPNNRRDISVIVLENISSADIIRECKKIAPKQLVEIYLFDVYRGIGIDKGYKSLSISFILQDYERTLKEKDIIAIVDKCINTIKLRFQAKLRDLTYGTYKS